MPHIRIHGFTAGDGQECRAEHRKGDQGWRMHQKCEGGNRTYRRQDLRRQYDAAHAKGSDHDEPREHDRAEDAADEAGSSALKEEKSDQNGDGERDDDRRQARRVHLQALDRAQHGNRRRDRAVAVKQCRAHKTKQKNGAPPCSGSGMTGAQEGKHRDDAALAAVVGA